jgi:predicted GNAT family N-acyltransferase
MVMQPVELQEKDIQNALDLVWEVFQEFEAPDYSQEGINTFKDFIHYPSILDMLRHDKIKFWGCFDQTRLAGIIAMRPPSHISLLFVKKEYQRRGIARSLFKTVVKECKQQEAETITVNSSPYAVKIYHRLGFKDLSEEKLTDGIRFTPMIYRM